MAAENNDKKPMPQWIKNSLLPESTKQYLYEQWLNGTLDPKAPPQDWGLITDVAEAIRKLTFRKPKIRTDVFPKQSLEQLQQASSEIAQNRNDLRLAISETDGIDVVFKGELLTLDEAIKQERNLSIVNDQYKNSIERKKPKVKDVDLNLQISLETAQMNSDEAYQTMLQEITAFPETSQPFRDRYFATLKTLDQVETKALNAGLTIPKTVTVNMGLPRRDVMAEPTTAQALRTPVATRAPSGITAQRGIGATVVIPAEDRAEQARFARMKTGELKPGTKATEEPPPPPPPTGTSAGKPERKITKSDVDAALVAANLADTPENRKKVREQLKAGKPIKPSNWEALVAEQAGEYAYLLGPEFEGVPELLRKAVEQDWFSSEQGKAQFLQELKKTPYGLNTSTKQQQFDLKTAGNKKVDIQANIDRIRTQYGEIQFDQATLEEIAGTAARNGASDIELGRLVYRAAFKRGAVSPDLTSPIAAKTALGGDDAARIKAIYRSYGVRADDEQVARILAGQPEPTTGTVMTEDMLRTNLRDLAKVSYQPFADLLDRGLSVQTIFSPYQQIAASTLEKSVNDVALTDANGTPTQFASALMGEKPMSLTDWITKLKSDDRYGWQFTSEAKQQASNLVMELEKAFGYRK